MPSVRTRPLYRCGMRDPRSRNLGRTGDGAWGRLILRNARAWRPPILIYSSRIRFPTMIASTPPDAIRSKGKSIGRMGSPVLGVLLVEFVLVWEFVAELPEPEPEPELPLLPLPEPEPEVSVPLLSPVPESSEPPGLSPPFFSH